MDNPTPKETSEEKSCETLKRRTLLERYLAATCLVFFVAFLIMVGLLLFLKNTQKISKKEVCLSNACKHEAGSILTNMDFTVDPCENFYQFSCGSKFKYKSIYGEQIRSFMELKDYMIRLSKEELQKPETIDDLPFVKKVKKYYQSCLNKPTDIREIVKEMSNILHLDDWPLTQDDKSKNLNLIEETAALAIVYKGSGLLFDMYKDANESIITMYSGSVFLSSSELLNKTEQKYIRVRQKYENLIDYVFTKLHLSADDSEKLRNEIVEFETSLAQIQVVDRDDNSTNSTIIELESTCQQIKWRHMFKFLFEYLGHVEEYSDEYLLDISSMEYVKDLCQLVGNTKPRIIYNSLIWNMFIRYFERFDFIFRQILIDLESYMQYRSTATNSLPGMYALPWKSCISNMESYVVQGLDYMMINTLQPGEQIKEVENYVEQIRKSLDEIFSDVPWMDKDSKNITKFLLKGIAYQVGYGKGSLNEEFLNKILDMNIADSYIENVFSVNWKEFSDNMFDPSIIEFIRKESMISPLDVSASYVPIIRALGVTLGLMNPPFYSYKGPSYLNFGGIAFVIAHEFSHAFDHFDIKTSNKMGNLTEKIDYEVANLNFSDKFWEEYKKRKTCLMNQYSQFPLEGNLTINGSETIGDNFSDNSGLTIAYRAYENYLKHHGEEPQLPGLNFGSRQMFFIGYAQLWCEMIESMKKAFEHDSHSPGRYRILVPLMNSPEFSKVFNCPRNSYMNPEHKCRIWE